MTRKADREKLIRGAYNLIREYQEIIALPSTPEERAQSQREIERQWDLIKGYRQEYLPLAADAEPKDVAQILVHFGQPDRDL